MSQEQLVQEENTNLKWEEGIIGTIESFLLKRFKFAPLYARALATSVVSTAIYKISVEDRKGPVRANVWFIYVSDSGTGVKTPPITMIRKLMFAYNKSRLSVTKFTPEGYTEFVQGTEAKKDKDGNIQRKEIPPHPVNLILRDEASVILGENKNSPAFSQQKEYLSGLWDGYIEGYYTRKCQFEGNVEVYVSLCASASSYFYRLLDEEFFLQGTGNRIMWITLEAFDSDYLDPSFFGLRGEHDKEFNELVLNVVGKLRRLEEVNGDKDDNEVELTQKAKVLWCNFHNECEDKKKTSSRNVASYLAKVPMNTLKLAMNYAASRLSIKANILIIQEEDMKRAVDDSKAYEEMWFKTIRQWRDYGQINKAEKRLPTSKYDLCKFAGYAIEKDGLITVSEIQGFDILPDRTKIGEILDIGEDKGWFKVIANASDNSMLTPEQYKRFKPRTGHIGNIYQITEKGRVEYSQF